MTFFDLSVWSCINLILRLSLHLCASQAMFMHEEGIFPSAAVAISVDNIMRCNFGAATIPQTCILECVFLMDKAKITSSDA